MRTVVVALLLSLCTATAGAAVPSSEREALVQLYAATAGDTWSDRTGWGGPAGTECDWSGVVCDESGAHIVELHRSSNGLTGQLPAVIDALTQLRVLDLSFNSIAGTIPAEIGDLPTLEVLDLGSNALTGSIPASVGELTSLKALDLSQNSLSGSIPSSLASASGLVELDLSVNGLSGSLPAWLGTLESLEELGLGFNHFHGVVPANVANLISLRRLDVSYNDLVGPLPDLSTLTSLESLDLGGNPIAAELPDWIFELSELRHLGFQESGLRGTIGPQLLSLTKLEELYGWENALEGTLGEWIGEMTSLRMLLLGDNRISGPIPRSITRLTRLTTLDLQGNFHTGSIPEDLGSLTELEYLSLAGNALSGEIPPSFSNLRKLIDVRLDHNDLTGQLPSLDGFDALEVLLLHVNRLEGTFPTTLYDAPKLYLVSLGSNRFSGSLPQSIGTMTALQILDISQNAFSGEIPSGITALQSLEAGGLNLSYNALHTSNPTVATFVDSKDSMSGEWASTQTVAPVNASTSNVTDRSAIISWTPIEYIYDGGGYRITASLTPDGDPVITTAVPGKESSSGSLRGLAADTTYHIRVHAFTSPNGYQRNLVLSTPSSSTSIRTTSPVLSPADVAVTRVPAGIVQIGGVAQSESELALTNHGDTPTTVTLSRVHETFYEIVPTALELGPGETKSAIVRVSAPQPAGGYWGTIGVSGVGVPPETFVSIELLAVDAPSGSVSAEASTSRLDFSGALDSVSTGVVSFRNTGDAQLTGVLAADVGWIRVPPAVVQIAPGEESNVTITVDRSLRSESERNGAVSGTLALIYVDGSGTSTAAFSGLRAFKTLPPGVSASTVRVVDTTGPGSTAATIPALASGEIARLIPGVRSIESAGESEATDIAISNATGVRPIDDVRVYLQPIAAGSTRVANLGSVDSNTATLLANVARSVYASSSGSLQLRSDQWQRLASTASLHLERSGKSVAAIHPIYRSDRAVRPGERSVITGLQRQGGTATLILQEASGSPVKVIVDLLRSDGSAARAPMAIEVPAWGSVAVSDGVLVESAVTLILRHADDSEGSFVGIVEIDEPSGDVSLLPDWSRVAGLDPSLARRIVYSERTTGNASRRRGVRRGSLDANAEEAAVSTTTTALWLFNDGDEPASGELVLNTPSGSQRRAAVTLAARQTLHYGDVHSSVFHSNRATGWISWNPARGNVHLQARISNGSGLGDVVPQSGRDEGLRLGESRFFAAVEDAASLDAAGSLRSRVVLHEIAGERARVRVTIQFASARSLTGTSVSREFELSALESRDLGGVAVAVLREAAETFGDLRNARVEIRVIEGAGAVQPLVITTESKDGDAMIRTE